MPKGKKAQPNGITFGMSMVTLMAVSIVLILTIVKIYMSNQIYHESKVVNSKKREEFFNKLAKEIPASFIEIGAKEVK